MIAYVQEIAKDLISRFESPQTDEFEIVPDRVHALVEELDRLDPRDFVPGAQFEFVEARIGTRALAKNTKPATWEDLLLGLANAQKEFSTAAIQLEELKRGTAIECAPGNDPTAAIQKIRDRLEVLSDRVDRAQDRLYEATQVCERVVTVLDSYAGRGSQAVVRSFAFVRNADLRSIIERDYKEFCQILFPGHAWKSAVVMAGSILEAILHDLLTHDAARIAQAMKSAKAPKKAGVVKNIQLNTSADEWKLIDLIEVSVDLGLLPASRADTIDQVLRDYRNFVHPKKEIKATHPCTEAEATLAKGALDGVCNHLT